MSDKWVAMPPMAITIDRESNGVIVLSWAIRGEFRTETEQVALDTLAEWIREQGRIIGEIKAQGGL